MGLDLYSKPSTRNSPEIDASSSSVDVSLTYAEKVAKPDAKAVAEIRTSGLKQRSVVDEKFDSRKNVLDRVRSFAMQFSWPMGRRMFLIALRFGAAASSCI
jgi:hypothetical protein